MPACQVSPPSSDSALIGQLEVSSQMLAKFFRSLYPSAPALCLSLEPVTSYTPLIASFDQIQLGMALQIITAYAVFQRP